MLQNPCSLDFVHIALIQVAMRRWGICQELKIATNQTDLSNTHLAVLASALSRFCEMTEEVWREPSHKKSFCQPPHTHQVGAHFKALNAHTLWQLAPLDLRWFSFHPNLAIWTMCSVVFPAAHIHATHCSMQWYFQHFSGFFSLLEGVEVY